MFNYGELYTFEITFPRGKYLQDGILGRSSEMMSLDQDLQNCLAYL